MTDLGDNIKKQRLSRGLSQRKLARLAEISNDYVSKIEQGKVENVGLVTLKKIATALGINVLEIQQKIGSYRADSKSGRVKEPKRPYGTAAQSLKILQDLWPHLKDGDRQILVNMAKRLAGR